jgi:hypothetical protein
MIGMQRGSEVRVPASVLLDVLPPAATMGIGSLPHRNARQAAEFALDAFDVATIPNLPKRSPAESPVAQALVGVTGVTLGQYGTVAVDPGQLDPDRPVATDIDRDQFVGFRTFLEVAAERRHAGPVAWHFTGPISVIVALLRAGADPAVAYEVGVTAVRGHVRALAGAVSAALPGTAQIVMIDEPLAGAAMTREFPISPDRCIDAVSSAMAVVEPIARVGVHCCDEIDATFLLDAGPDVLSLKVTPGVLDHAGYVDRFLERGGTIAWGAVATGGPIGVTANRSWHQLSSLWHDLARRGCAPRRLRDQSLLTPECGLGAHGVSVAERICHSLRDIGRAARSDSTTAKLLLGG